MKKVFIISIILAVLHSILFWGKSLGASVTLFSVAALFGIMYIFERNGKIRNSKAFLLSIPIILLSITYFIFNNLFFTILNMIVIIILFATMITFAIFDYKEIIKKISLIIFRPIIKIEDMLRDCGNEFSKNEKKCKNESKNKNVKKIMLGILVSIPILIIILMLLSSADTIFASGINQITHTIFNLIGQIELGDIFYRILLIALITIYIMAFVYNIYDMQEEQNENNYENNQRFDNKIRVDSIVSNTILTILNFVYLIFCYIQIVNLFIGYSNLQEYEYANYARQGFFQLMVVSLINLIIILVTTHNKNETTEKQKRYSQIMNIMLAIFTVIILISSFMRMNLYEQAFGYTFLRLMVYFILITEAILIIPTVMYIFNNRIKLLKIYSIIILTMYIIVNYSNINGMIVNKNISLYLENEEISAKEIDFDYLRTTGIDGAVEMTKWLDKVEGELQIDIIGQIYMEYKDIEKMSIPEININKVILKNRAEDIFNK